jgi:glyoxylase-like metal-dependent hydrolase (beta-lactamase superfamily II)
VPVQFERTESSLWQTSSVIAVEDGSAVLVDPGITSDEVEAIAARVESMRGDVTAILITHAHWDHLTGVGRFPSAEVLAGPETAEIIRSGALNSRVKEQARAHGFRRPEPPRCDRVLTPGLAARVGPLVVETLPVPGHTSDSMAFRIRAAGALVVGDYLSTYEFPFVYHSTAAYRATLAALADVLDHDPPERIVAGHGHCLDPHRARTIAEEDLGYLHHLRATMAEALASGAGETDAVAAGAAIEPPRTTVPSEERRVENARHQLEELAPS